MNISEIAKALNQKPKGTIFTYTIGRKAKTRKSYDGAEIIKKSVAQGMVGTDYANRKPVREAVENGERDAPELPSHIAETFTVDGIKFWRGSNGNVYFPVCATGNKPQTQWLIDGESVDLDEIKDFLLASEYAKSPSKEDLADKGQVPFVAVNIENIEAIH